MVKQLILSKWLFMQGERYCIDDPISAGLAISLFQDSIEMFIRSLVKEFDVEVDKITPFYKYFELIKKAKNNRNKDELPLKAKMLELNNARVGFKHSGILPDAREAQKFRGYTEDFLRVSFEKFFSEDFDQITLSSLIRFGDVKEHVQIAEKRFEEGDYIESISEIAKADKLLFDKLDSYIPPVDYNIRGDFSDLPQEFNSHISHKFNSLYDYLDMLRSLNIVSMCGVSINDYSKYKSVLPNALQSDSGNFQIMHWHNKYKKEDVKRSISFVINLSLKIQLVITEDKK